MENLCKSYLYHKTNYYESFNEYVCLNNINKNYLNIICCNIRSVNAHFDELLLILGNDKNFKDIDVIILTET